MSKKTRDRIELYLSDKGARFDRGCHYDERGGEHPLDCFVHVGMVADSCLIYPKGEWDGMALCRYFPRQDGVEFYDTLYGQQDYSTPLRIHNVGSTPLRVRFQFYPPVWTVLPGEQTDILPYCAEGADPEA